MVSPTRNTAPERPRSPLDDLLAPPPVLVHRHAAPAARRPPSTRPDKPVVVEHAHGDTPACTCRCAYHGNAAHAVPLRVYQEHNPAVEALAHIPWPGKGEGGGAPLTDLEKAFAITRERAAEREQVLADKERAEEYGHRAQESTNSGRRIYFIYLLFMPSSKLTTMIQSLLETGAKPLQCVERKTIYWSGT